MSKTKGDLAESIFVTRCLMAGIVVCTPFGDNEPYDFITYHGGKFSKVQVKCTSHVQKSKWNSVEYKLHGGRGSDSKEKYTSEHIDFIAGFVIPEQVWYIIPVEEVSSVSLGVFPHNDNSKGKYEQFKNKFKLLKGKETSKEEDDKDTVKNFDLI